MGTFFASSTALFDTSLASISAFVLEKIPIILGIIAGLGLLAWAFYRVMGTIRRV